MIINPELLNEIDEKKALIEIDDCARDLTLIVSENLQTDSLYHSNLLEFPNHREEAREKKTEFKDALSNLKNAWEFAKSKYKGMIDVQFLEEVVSKVSNDKGKLGIIWQEGKVAIEGNSAIQPITRDKLQRNLDVLLGYVNSTGMHPIERAELFHFHLVRIHPFGDGNGRTSRLIQNLILAFEGYAPPVVLVTERVPYMQMLRNAIKGYNEREGSGFIEAWNSPLKVSNRESTFYNYLASKVNASMDRQFTALSGTSSYEIELRGRNLDPGYVMACKRVLTNAIRSQDLLAQVRVISLRGNRPRLEVRGNLDISQIQHVLDKQQFVGRYSIRQN